MTAMIEWMKWLVCLLPRGERSESDKGSVTIENVVWAIAVIAIAAIVVAAITAYVTNRSGELMGP